MGGLCEESFSGSGRGVGREWEGSGKGVGGEWEGSGEQEGGIVGVETGGGGGSEMGSVTEEENKSRTSIDASLTSGTKRRTT